MSEQDAKKILKNLHSENSLILKEFKSILEHFLKNKDINQLIDYTQEIYGKISWDKKTKDINIENSNIEYKTILIHLLNIFIANTRNANIEDFENTPIEYKRIVNIIEGFRR